MWIPASGSASHPSAALMRPPSRHLKLLHVHDVLPFQLIELALQSAKMLWVARVFQCALKALLPSRSQFCFSSLMRKQSLRPNAPAAAARI